MFSTGELKLVTVVALISYAKSRDVKVWDTTPGYLSGWVFQSVGVAVLQQCQELCQYTSDCGSVNWNHKLRVCLLNKKSDNPEILQHYKNWVHARIVSETGEKKCSAKCPGRKLCIPVLNSAALCATSLPGKVVTSTFSETLESTTKATVSPEQAAAEQQNTRVSSFKTPTASSVEATDVDGLPNALTRITSSSDAGKEAIAPSTTTHGDSFSIHSNYILTSLNGDYETGQLYSSSMYVQENEAGNSDSQTRNAHVQSRTDKSYKTMAELVIVSSGDSAYETSAPQSPMRSISTYTSSNTSIYTNNDASASTSISTSATTSNSTSATTINSTSAVTSRTTSTTTQSPSTSTKMTTLTRAASKKPPTPQPKPWLKYTAREKKKMTAMYYHRNPMTVRCAEFQLPFKEFKDTCSVDDMVRRDGGECQCKTGLHYNPHTNSCVRRCKKYGSSFLLQSRLYCIGGHNDREFPSRSIQNCITACIKERTFVCRSFDYWVSTCYLSKDTRADVRRAWKPYCGCLYYQRMCAN